MLIEQPQDGSGAMPPRISSDMGPAIGPDQVAFLNTLLQYSSDGIIVLDLDGKVRSWNGAAAGIYGWQLEEILEQPLDDLFGPKLAIWWQAVREGDRLQHRPVRQTQQHRHKNGEPVHVNITLALLRDRHNRPVGYLLMVQDVTLQTLAEEQATQVKKETTELNEANARLRQQVRTDRLQLTQISQLNRQLRQISDTARQLNGLLDIDELLHTAIDRIQHHFNFYQVLIYLADPLTDQLILRQGSGEIGRLLIQRGHAIAQDATPSLVARAARNMQVIGANDVRLSQHFLPNSALRNTRSELAIPLVAGSTLIGVLDLQDTVPHRFNESDTNLLTMLAGHLSVTLIKAQLFAEHAMLLTELQEQTRALSQSNDELEQFAYVASHDLQEPLRAVSNYLQMVQRRHAQSLNSEGNEFVSYALQGTERMQQLIADLLHFSRIGRQAVQRQVVASHDLLQEAVARLEAQMEASSASIQVGYMPTIKGDPVKLVSLFQNLLSNALKYRSEHRPVITINAERQGNYWLFSVKDNGIGFANEYRDRIFLIFQRLHTQEEYPGTGMGLALCKKIVEQHQGHIYAQSDPGRGATFYFTLPAG
ncbi:MAG: PAS domain S-box protein [Anaerolineales bacterium]|nr:PAS domain S-box protein [Anaerolineales bacterium]